VYHELPIEKEVSREGEKESVRERAGKRERERERERERVHGLFVGRNNPIDSLCGRSHADTLFGFARLRTKANV